MPSEDMSANVPEHCAVFSVHDRDRLLYAVLESPASNAGPGALGLLLMQAAADVAAQSNDPGRWPSHLADALHLRIRKQSNDGPRVGWAFFAAVAVTQGHIFVCHVGDLRVHLVQGGRLIQSTREHVIANESAEWVRATYGDIDMSGHQTVATRSVGAEPFRPENSTWRNSDELTLFICDSEYHRHRTADAYIDEARQLRAHPSDAGSAFAAWLARS
jgi:hypothetical protein